MELINTIKRPSSFASTECLYRETRGGIFPPLLGTRVNGLSRTLSVDGQGLPKPLNKQRRLMEQPTDTDRIALCVGVLMEDLTRQRATKRSEC